MEFLLEFILGKAYRSVDGYSRLKALSDTRSQKSLEIIPLDPLSNPLDGLLQFFFAIAIVTFFATLILGYYDGFTYVHAYVVIGSVIASAFFLWLLFHCDSRYFLDMKNRRIIYRFKFFVQLVEKVLVSFLNIASVELDAKEVGRWVYYLVIVKKDLSRVPLSRSGYSQSGLPEAGQLIADAIKCPYRTGNRIEKFRIMGL